MWEKAFKDGICAEGWSTDFKHEFKKGDLGKGIVETLKNGKPKYNFYCKKCYEIRFLYKGEPKIDIGLHL